MLMQLPNRHNPYNERDEPRRKKPLMLIVLPRWSESSTEQALPNRPSPYTEAEEPMRTNARMLREDPMWSRSNTWWGHGGVRFFEINLLTF